MDRRMFIIFALVFLFGGIEFSVILPTLWLYLQSTYNSPEYMFGLVLSAYSLSAFLVSPLMGRVADKFRCPKQIFIVCAMFETVGSFLYFIGISQWLCVASRFISGLGAAGEAIAIAETSRYTKDTERTSIMSMLVAIRQLSLLAAPGLNVVLRLADFKIGPFEVNKYTSPGAFLTAMWMLLILLVLVIFKNPPKEDVSVVADQNQETAVVPEDDVKEDIVVNDDPHAPLLASTTFGQSQSYHSLNQTESTESKIDEDDKCRESCVQHREPPDFCGSSYDILVSAELYMQSADFNYGSRSASDLQDDDLSYNENHFASPSRCSSIQGKSSKVTDEEYVVKAQSAFDDPVQREGLAKFLCNEYILDHIVALLMLMFVSTFSQVCLETMFTPLAQLYLDFGEFENSIFFCLCGVVIIITFVLVSKLSKSMTDRSLILIGGVLLLMTNIGLIIFLPMCPLHNFKHNVPLFTVMVFFDVVSLPFLLVCSTSLYSKLTRKETQGLSQGIRRAFVGFATILSPLWASSSIKQLHLMLGVMIAIQAMSMGMCLLSYKRLKAPSSATPTENGTTVSAKA